MTVSVAVNDGPGLRRAIADTAARVVVNCAGPALDIGTAVLDAAFAEGAHYVDASIEPGFIAHVHREYRRGGARGAVAVAGCGARGAVGQWAAEVATSILGSDAHDVAIAWGHAAGTYLRPSVAAWLGAASEGFYRRGGREFPERRSFAFPSPFGEGVGLWVPGPEEALLREGTRDARVRTYTALAPGCAANRAWATWEMATGAGIPPLCRTLLSSWGRMHLEWYFPGPPHRARDGVCMVAEARRNDHCAAIALIADDLYALSVHALEIVVERLLAHPVHRNGVLTPADIVDSHDVLAALARTGIARVSSRSRSTANQEDACSPNPSRTTVGTQTYGTSSKLSLARRSTAKRSSAT
jgi:short subunit dehydrogenase-like uncharacterized protein